MSDSFVLNLRAGELADAIADFQKTPEARVMLRQIKYKPINGLPKTAILALLSVDNQDLEIVSTGDYLDFAIAPAGTVEEEKA